MPLSLKRVVLNYAGNNISGTIETFFERPIKVAIYNDRNYFRY